MKWITFRGHSVSFLQVLLFCVTVVTTLMAGFEFESIHLISELEWGQVNLQTTLIASTFAIPVLVILFSHEMGHYLTAKKIGVEVTFPYFLPAIPIPTVGLLPAIGTFGAFIKMNAERLTSWELLRIAAWGPVAGYVFALPALLIGIAISPVQPVHSTSATLGPTLLIMLGEHLFHPHIPQGCDVMLSPLAMAGWFGCFLTSLNLMPVGQLDGGHIAYATFGKGWNRISPFVFALLIAMGIFNFTGWLFFAALVFKLGVRHPDTVVDDRVEPRQWWLTAISMVMLLTTFTPTPFTGMSLLDVVGSYIH